MTAWNTKGGAGGHEKINFVMEWAKSKTSHDRKEKAPKIDKPRCTTIKFSWIAGVTPPFRDFQTRFEKNLAHFERFFKTEIQGVKNGLPDKEIWAYMEPGLNFKTDELLTKNKGKNKCKKQELKFWTPKIT